MPYFCSRFLACSYPAEFHLSASCTVASFMSQSSPASPASFTLVRLLLRPSHVCSFSSLRPQPGAASPGRCQILPRLHSESARCASIKPRCAQGAHPISYHCGSMTCLLWSHPAPAAAAQWAVLSHSRCCVQRPLPVLRHLKSPLPVTLWMPSCHSAADCSVSLACLVLSPPAPHPSASCQVCFLAPIPFLHPRSSSFLFHPSSRSFDLHPA